MGFSTNTKHKTTGSAIGPPDQVAKGWVNFSGLDTSIVRNSFNVTSVSDNGTGLFTINWDTAFANADYVITVTAGNTGQEEHFTGTRGAGVATSSAIYTANNAGGLANATFINVIAFGGD